MFATEALAAAHRATQRCAGVVTGCFPMWTPENFTDIFQHLNDVVCHPTFNGNDRAGYERPMFLIFDRACEMSESIRGGGVLAPFAWRWLHVHDGLAVMLRVDRPHFLIHAPEHIHCRCAGFPASSLSVRPLMHP